MTELELTFPKLNHFWLDSGLLGLYELLHEGKVPVTLDDSAMTLRGEEREIEAALDGAYDTLVARYYNLSTQRQRDNVASHNFYYDSITDVFKDFPKRKARGIARLIYDKAPRPAGTVVKWDRKDKRDIEVNGKVVKRMRGVLPASHAHLQERMDAFLDTHGLDVTTNGLLIDRPNEIRPKLPKRRLITRKEKCRGACYLCGDEAETLADINQTVFPFITGSSGGRSFNTLAGAPEKVCWQCAFIGKFVPVNGFYMTGRDQIFAFFPYSTSLTKMDELHGLLKDSVYEDPNHTKNFTHFFPIGTYEEGFFQRPFEVTFAFLHTLYRKLPIWKEPEEIDYDELFGITLAKAPLEFVVVHAVKKGDTYLGKLVWPFTQVVYFFRLMNALELAGVNIKEVMELLVDRSETQFEHKTLVRNRVCEHILTQQPIVSLIERYSFSADLSNLKPLFDLVIHYEGIIRKEDRDTMTPEEQAAAVTLGRRIGAAVGHTARGKRGAAEKGDLFALRKVRKKVDFLNQLNRLQFRYDLVVPADVYEGKLTDKNYAEFKDFCMLAALNSFNAAVRPAKEDTVKGP